MSENFYDILGVANTSPFDEIKKAYRKLSLKYHPDRNNSSEGIQIMRKINEAYEILSDEDARKKYDHAQKPSSSAKFDDFETIFQSFFQNDPTKNPSAAAAAFFASAGAAAAPAFFPNLPSHLTSAMFLQKPAPIMKNVNVTFPQVFSGGYVPLEIERWIIDKGVKMFETETLYLTIPSGIDENELLIIKEKGNILNDQKGDIKIFVKISNSTEFKRSGIDLLFEKTISLKEALCGFSFQFNFLDGKTYTLNNLSNQPHSHNIIPPNYQKIIPNMGLKRCTQDANVIPQGNLIILFKIEFPDKLTDEQILTLQSIL